MLSTPTPVPRASRGPIPAPANRAILPLATGVELAGIRMTYQAGEEIYGDGEPADMIYKVILGSVRCFTMRHDGRRQIEAFYYPEDIFGLDEHLVHHSSAEAICAKTSIIAVRRCLLEGTAAGNAAISHQALLLVSQACQESRHHALLLGCKHATERMASFLLDMLRRQATLSVVNLPMCRSDIADYLGLTIETVSRTLTQFERDGLIAMPSNRFIKLLDMDALRSLSA